MSARRYTDPHKYSRCPDCLRKTVYWKGLPNGEDNYRCRRQECGFFFFTLGDSESDRKNEARWEAANAVPNPKGE